MDFFGDFCLACDGQTNGGDYCSQTCQLAGLDRYGTSEPASPTYSHGKAVAHRATGSVSSGLYLPPAIDFGMYRVPSDTSVSMKTSSPPAEQISEQARNNLKDYAGSFDQTRTLRRRMSMQSNDDDKSQSSR